MAFIRQEIRDVAVLSRVKGMLQPTGGSFLVHWIDESMYASSCTQRRLYYASTFYIYTASRSYCSSLSCTHTTFPPSKATSRCPAVESMAIFVERERHSVQHLRLIQSSHVTRRASLHERPQKQKHHRNTPDRKHSSYRCKPPTR